MGGTRFEENKEIAKDATNWQGWQDFQELHRGVRGLENKAIRQLGSLGGGNHFIEVCIDTENRVWLMLLSWCGENYVSIDGKKYLNSMKTRHKKCDS